MKKAVSILFTASVTFVLFFCMPVYADWYQNGTTWRFSQGGKDLSNTWVYDKDNIFYHLDSNGNYDGGKKEFLHSSEGLDKDVLRSAYHSMQDMGYLLEGDTYFKQALNLINEEREKSGVAPLVLDYDRSVLASYINANMHKNNYFSHYHTSETEAECILVARKLFGDSLSVDAENIHKYWESSSLGVNVNDAWIRGNIKRGHESLVESSGHHKNIVNPDYKKVGIGLTVIKNEATNTVYFYYTQEFVH
jgi:cysteine-rich secretory protein family